MTVVETTVWLYRPLENPQTGRWQLLRGRDDGGLELISEDFGSQEAAKMVADMLNAEVTLAHEATIEREMQRLRESIGLNSLRTK